MASGSRPITNESQTSLADSSYTDQSTIYGTARSRQSTNADTIQIDSGDEHEHDAQDEWRNTFSFEDEARDTMNDHLDEDEDDTRTILAYDGQRNSVSSNSRASLEEGSIPPVTPFNKITNTHSVLEVVANVTKSTLGAGVTGLPYAIANCGLVAGIVLLTAVTWLVAASYIILVIMSRYCGTSGRGTYEGLTQVALGPFGPWLYDSITFIGCLGTDVSYFIIIADTVTTVFGQYTSASLLVNRTFIISFAAVVCMLPLILFRHIGSLAKVSLFSFALYPFILIAIGVRAPAYATHTDLVLPPGVDIIGPNVWSGVAIMALAMQAQQTCFLHYSSLARPTQQRWSISIVAAMAVAFAVSLAFALIGYMSFGLATRDNIFNNFPADDTLINIARVCMAFTLVFSYPMMFFPARDACHGIISRTKAFFSKETLTAADVHYATTASRTYFLSITIPLWLLTAFIALMVDDLGRVFEFVGAFTSISLAFLIPGACFISLFYIRTQKPLLWNDDELANVILADEEDENEDEDEDTAQGSSDLSPYNNGMPNASSSTSLLLPKRSKRRAVPSSPGAQVIDPLLVLKEAELQRRAIGRRWWMDGVVFLGFLPLGMVCLVIGTYHSLR